MSVRFQTRGDSPNLLSNSRTCPSLFYPTTAQDGKLARIRIPGGLLNLQQCRVLAEVSDRLGSSTIDVTNRANLQIRGLEGSIPPEILHQLQDAGLAAKIIELDRFRNIMASPTAGIDSEQLIDTRPLVEQLDEYLSSQPILAELSPKFSIGLDGGERVSIQQQPNDILLKAVRVESDRQGIFFHLYLAGIETNVAVAPEDCIAVVGAIAQVYLDLVPQDTTRKPRLKQLLQKIGTDNYVSFVQTYLPFELYNLSLRRSTSLCRSATSQQYFHLGTYPQRQPHLSYIGIALPLGRLTTSQLRQISDITQICGAGSLRLSPWRSFLLPDIGDRDLSTVQQQLEKLGLSATTNNIWGRLVACSGTTGCAASFTDTQGDALALAQYIENNLTLDRPVTIHFSGCPKSCAHHGSSDITLVGTAIAENSHTIAGYHLYVGDIEHPFGRLFLSNLKPTQLPEKITQILSIYQLRRTNRAQSFLEFVNQSSLDRLHQWFNEGKS